MEQSLTRKRAKTVHTISRILRLTLALILFPAIATAESPKTIPRIDVVFSPDGRCTERIIDEIRKATKIVHVQAYSFTSAPIAKAIREAQKRGVLCQVVLDASQAAQDDSGLDFLRNPSIPTWLDSRHAIAHNSIVIIDRSTVITGSFDFTEAAEERNAENVIIITGDSNLAEKYLRNFAKHRDHSRKYEGRTEATSNPRAPPVVEQPRKDSPQPTSDVTVYVTRTGKKYHRGSCSFLRKSKFPMKLSEAKRNFGPCSRCRPPT